MRNLAGGGDERRLLHDFSIWQRDVRSVVDLGVYRTVERNLMLGDARPEPVTIAETTAAAFRLVRVPPLIGRPLLDADEQPGATPVVVLGYRVVAAAVQRTCATSSDKPSNSGRPQRRSWA